VTGVLRRLHLLDARISAAVSGGRDSIVLLHLLHAVARRHPLRLSAVHVDHGISRNASRWAQFCAARCAALGVEMHSVRVDVARDAGSGQEAAARAARYAVFARQEVDVVALAHHLDDQAETLLLQLLRGAGAAGLAAMPQLRRLEHSPVLLVRPLLEIPREQIDAYARSRSLEWVEDESNQSLDFDRNYLRHEVLPRIAARFPAYRQTWLRASRNLAELDEIAQDVARADAVQAQTGDGLRVAALRALPPGRRLNLLRWFLQTQGVPSPPRERLEESVAQLLGAGADRSPSVRMGAAALRRHRGRIELVAACAPCTGWTVRWRGEEELVLPPGYGRLRLRPSLGEGLDARRLRAGAVVVAPRRGGERIKLSAARPQRSLKNLLREAELPPWERERLPLLFCGSALAWVPGVGWDCRMQAQPGEPGIVPEWLRA
jgi:tRNA(Ile)-lysidine synthase